MRRMRFLAFALISFVAALLGTFLSPGTWLHRALSLSLCGLLSFNSTLCTVSSIKSAEEANAINSVKIETPLVNIADYLLADRASEFGNPPPSINPAPRNSPNNSPAPPPFPSDPGPNFPVRSPDFDIPQQNQTASNDKDCNLPSKVYSFFVNGIRLKGLDISKNRALIERLLSKAGIDVENFSFVENPSGVTQGVGDLFESLRQVLLSHSPSDSRKVVDAITRRIKNIEEEQKSKNEKTNCECKIARPKYLIIGYSQGNFFVEDAVNQLSQILPEVAKERTTVLAISSFTDFNAARSNVKAIASLLRKDDFPAKFNWVPGVEPLVGKQGQELPGRKILDSHALANYLGEATDPKYQKYADDTLEEAVSMVKALVEFDSGEYEKDKNCNQCGQQTEARGQQGRYPKTFELGSTNGTIRISYQMCPIADKLEVFYEKGLIGGTGDFVSGAGTLEIPFKGTSSKVTIVVTGNPNDSNTKWAYILACPGQPARQPNVDPRTCT